MPRFARCGAAPPDGGLGVFLMHDRTEPTLALQRSRWAIRASLAAASLLAMATSAVAQTQGPGSAAEQGASAAAAPTAVGEAEPSSPLERTTAASLRVDTKLDRKQVERTQQADAKRDEEILLLKKLIPEAPKSRKAEMIFRLAELFWQKSKYRYTQEFEEFEGAYDKWVQAGQQGAPPKTQDFLRESQLIKKNALKLYQRVLTEYPTYERNDEVLFYLGYNEYEDGRTKRAISHYWTLIKQFPKSRLVADSYLQLGEHFFNNNQVIEARKAYQRATSSDEARIKYYALYKLAWCDYNIKRYAAGIQKLKSVVDHSESVRDRKTLQLGSEALGDLARFFSYVDEVDSAFTYFRTKGGEDVALRYTTRLGALYHEQGKWPLEIATYRLLIDRYPMNEKAPNLQANIVEAYSKLGRKDKVRAEVERLVDLYRRDTPWYRYQQDRGEAGRAALEYAYDVTETKLRNLVTEYHRDAQQRRDAPTYQLARDIYAKYLEAFPETTAAYQMRYFYAEVLWALRQWEDAALQYRQVAQTKATDGDGEGRYSRFAAYNQILAYERILKTGKRRGSLRAVKRVREKQKKGRSDAKTTTRIRLADLDKDKTYALQPIPELEQRLSEACDLYFNIADASDRDLPAIKFKAAYIYYKYNHFVEAAKRYFEIIETWPGDPLSKKAANLVLDSLYVQKKWDELIFYAGKFRDNRRLTRGDRDFQDEIQVVLEGATYLSIQASEQKARDTDEGAERAARLASVASRFRKFQSDFPRSKYAPKATYSAVLIYDQADELDHAIEMAELMKREYPKSDRRLLQNNDWRLAQFYERIADFKTSAARFDEYSKRYPQDDLAADALFNAGVYYQGLSQPDRAIQRFKSYITKYAQRDDVADIYWRICELQERKRDYSAAAACFDRFRTKHPRAPKAKIYGSRHRHALLLEKMKKRSSALQEYRWLVRQYDRLPARDREAPVPQRAVAHAAFELLEPEFGKYRTMRVTLQKRTLVAKLKKAEALACISTPEKPCERDGKYVGVLKYGNAEYGICALTRIGQVYLNVATSIRDAPIPRRLTYEQQDIYRTELENLALGPEEKGRQALESALTKAYELSVYGDCTRSAQRHLETLNPDRFPDLQRRGYLGADGLITEGLRDVGVDASAAEWSPVDGPGRAPAIQTQRNLAPGAAARTGAGASR